MTTFETKQKVRELKTKKQKKIFNEIIKDFFVDCYSEIKILIVAEGTPKNYKQIQNKLVTWIENKIWKYSDEDKQLIANYFILFFSDTFEQYDISPIFFICLKEILKPFLKINEEIKSI